MFKIEIKVLSRVLSVFACIFLQNCLVGSNCGMYTIKWSFFRQISKPFVSLTSSQQRYVYRTVLFPFWYIISPIIFAFSLFIATLFNTILRCPVGFFLLSSTLYKPISKRRIARIYAAGWNIKRFLNIRSVDRLRFKVVGVMSSENINTIYFRILE